MVREVREVERRLASLLRTLRNEKKWTRDELARRADLNPDHVGAVERGDATLTFDVLLKFLQAFDLQPSAFFRRDELLVLREGSGPGPRPRKRRFPEHAERPYTTTLGFALTYERELRKKHWSQEMLAATVGIPRARLSRIENGTARPSVVLVLQLAQAMKIDPVKLVFYIRVPARRRNRG